MFSRIDIRKIIVAHMRTIRIIGKGLDYWGIFLFFISPAIMATIIVCFSNINFEKSISNFLAAECIVGGFLFNPLALIYSILEKIKEKCPENDVKMQYAKEIHINISFSILIALVGSFFLVIDDLIVPKTTSSLPHYLFMIKHVINWVNYFLLGTFFLSLLFILNRIYILLDNDN